MPNGSFREYLNWQVDKDENYYKEGTTYYSEKNITNLIPGPSTVPPAKKECILPIISNPPYLPI